MSNHATMLLLIAILIFASVAQVGAAVHPGFRVAMCQIRIEDGDVTGNMIRAEQAIREAAKQGAVFINIPEAADFGWLYENARRDAFTIPGKYTNFLAKLAKELNVWITAGCLEKAGDKTYNSAVIINRQGKIVLKHRKINTLPLLTKSLYDAGKAGDVKTVDTEFGRIGLTICADNFKRANPQMVAAQGGWLLVAPHGFAAKVGELEGNSNSFRRHICGTAKVAGLWVIGTDVVMGRIISGPWKGWLHTGKSTIANPKGEAVAVAKFLYPDLVVYDIPAEK
jgi:predicted amidohydrolase